MLSQLRFFSEHGLTIVVRAQAITPCLYMKVVLGSSHPSQCAGIGTCHYEKNMSALSGIKQHGKLHGQNILRTEWYLYSGSTFRMSRKSKPEHRSCLCSSREEKTMRVKLLTWLLALLSVMCAFTTSRICAVNSFISSRGIILKATRLFLFY